MINEVSSNTRLNKRSTSMTVRCHIRRDVPSCACAAVNNRFWREKPTV